jgi:hypothetical protein
VSRRREIGLAGLLAGALLVALPSMADPAATPLEPPPASSPPPVAPPLADLNGRIAEFLAAMAEQYPTVAGQYGREQEEQLLKTLTAAFPGVEYLPAGVAPMPEEPRHNDGPYAAIIVAAQKVLYVRLDDFRKGTVKKARKDIEDAARLVRAPVGIVFDLRNGAGDEYAGAAQLLRLFHDEALKADARVDGDEASSIHLPAIVLIGRDTIGAAEVFAVLLERSGNALTLGQKTAGRPFARKKVLLRNGDMLLVPDIPPPLRAVAAVPVKPAVAAQAMPQVAYEKLAGTVNGDQEDACLQRAIDLLLSLHALHERVPNRK